MVSLDALTYAGNLDNLTGAMSHERLSFVHGDIRDVDLVRDVVSEVDVIVNAAAESHVEKFGDDTPLGRAAQPAELASTYVYLASDESSYVSGARVAVTGGRPIL